MIIKKIQNAKNIFKICKNTITNPVKFQNVPDAFTQDMYKLRCVEALKSDKPYELAILLDKKSGKFINEYSGNALECKIDLPSNSAVLLHGHPPINGVSLPVSVQDFILMNNSNIDKIVAYNIKGQQSLLQKNANFVRLNPKQISRLKGDYIDFLIKTAPDTCQINDLIKYCLKNKDSLMVKQEIAERLTGLQYKSPEIIDDFWHKKAPQLNLEYFSNYD